MEYTVWDNTSDLYTDCGPELPMLVADVVAEGDQIYDHS
jgi:hypothetical protein